MALRNNNHLPSHYDEPGMITQLQEHTTPEDPRVALELIRQTNQAREMAIGQATMDAVAKHDIGGPGIMTARQSNKLRNDIRSEA